MKRLVLALVVVASMAAFSTPAMAAHGYSSGCYSSPWSGGYYYGGYRPYGGHHGHRSYRSYGGHHGHHGHHGRHSSFGIQSSRGSFYFGW